MNTEFIVFCEKTMKVLNSHDFIPWKWEGYNIEFEEIMLFFPYLMTIINLEIQHV